VSILLALLLQVGMNPAADPGLGLPEELLDRPPRNGESQAAVDPDAQWLSECLDQLAKEPTRAHAQAQIRRNDTSGTPRILANHCLGLAATELSLWDDAVTAFVAARDETPAEELSARARFGIMAGNAAMGSGDAQAALELLEVAEAEARSAASATLEALAALDRARALVALEQPHEAITALSTATRLEPDKAEGWLLTATLFRRLGRLEDAQEAIERASRLAPMEADIGLEAGVIAVLSGRDEAARQSWQSVIDIQPDSLAAQTARGYLEQLGPPVETPAPTP
jgi:tetratricopeptide (TPR) repeat protein